MWVGENESAKFWASVLNNLKNRKIEDILITCTDNLTGFSEAIAAVFLKIHRFWDRANKAYIEVYRIRWVTPTNFTAFDAFGGNGALIVLCCLFC